MLVLTYYFELFLNRIGVVLNVIKQTLNMTIKLHFINTVLKTLITLRYSGTFLFFVCVLTAHAIGLSLSSVRMSECKCCQSLWRRDS